MEDKQLASYQSGPRMAIYTYNIILTNRLSIVSYSDAHSD